jgi:glycerol-3-phosphate acyltransferase PlsY
MSVDAEKLAQLETEAKLQLRVARAILQQRLGMCGNVLLVAWLLAVIFVLIWFALCPLIHSQSLSSNWIAPMLRIQPEYLARLNALGMTAWKLASYLLFLLPGLALKICASAMGKA